jgi:molecular chaperone DnaK
MYAQAQQTPPQDPAGEHAPGDEEGVVDAEIVDEERADGEGRDRS